MLASSDSSTKAQLPLPPPERSTFNTRLRAVAASIGEPAWVMFSMFGLATAVMIALFKTIPPLEALSESTVGQLVSNTAVYGLAVFFVFLPLLLKKKKAEIIELVGLRKSPTISGFAWAIAAFAIYFWTTIIVTILLAQIPGFDAEQHQEVGFNDVTTLTEYIMAFVGLVILPPIFEEVLFRGYLYGRLRRYMGFGFSMLVTSATFGLVHGQWNVGVDTFVLSIFLCFLREHTGSLWAPILLHALKNGLAYFFLFIAPLLGFNLL